MRVEKSFKVFVVILYLGILGACSGDNTLPEASNGDDNLVTQVTPGTSNNSSVQPESGAANQPTTTPEISPPENTTSSGEQTVLNDYVTDLDKPEEASRFLIQAGLGGTEADYKKLVGQNASEWVSSQLMAAPGETYVARLLRAFPDGTPPSGKPASQLFWEDLINGDDQLRTRMVFALSQIIVASDASGGSANTLATGYYMDLLEKHAFGNYRELLTDITYSPMMAKYLTYYRNRKANEKTGRQPDENYARELMQLFTIGLVELNPDGTRKLDELGNEIETYNNQDITGLSRVFTGLSSNQANFKDDATAANKSMPLKMFDEQHSPLEKHFLGTLIPANTPGDESIGIALDTLFNHPNVGPFIAHKLIQRFTASSPTPDYVLRVATAFNNGLYKAEDGTTFGDGRRGSLAATIAATLLDTSVHDMATLQADNRTGKVREPVLRFAQLLRAFNASPVDILNNESALGNTSSPSDKLAQHPMRAGSVFNFYRPGFVAPNTESGDAGLTVPELQLFNEGSVLGFINFVTKFAVQRSRKPGESPSLVPDYTAAVSLSDDSNTLIEYLDTLLTAGTLSDDEKLRIVTIVESIPITESNAQTDRLSRVHVAVVAIMGSSANATL